MCLFYSNFEYKNALDARKTGVKLKLTFPGGHAPDPSINPPPFQGEEASGCLTVFFSPGYGPVFTL